jgi:hypothetical protein
VSGVFQFLSREQNGKVPAVLFRQRKLRFSRFISFFLLRLGRAQLANEVAAAQTLGAEGLAKDNARGSLQADLDKVNMLLSS